MKYLYTLQKLSFCCQILPRVISKRIGSASTPVDLERVAMPKQNAAARS